MKNFTWIKATIIIILIALIGTIYYIFKPIRTIDEDEVVLNEEIIEKKGIYYSGDCDLHAVNKYTGTDTCYHENGKVKATFTIKDGFPNGHWEQFDTTGNKTIDLYFDNGQLVKKEFSK